MSNETLITGKWHTVRWKGFKVEWRDFQNILDNRSGEIYDLFLIA